MSASPVVQRRDFLKISVAASGGLMIGFYLPRASKLAAAQNDFMPNAFVRIGTDEKITVIVNHSEMGQGVYTSLPMILADELDADWKMVGFEPAPVDKKYNHPVFGMQMTGGSTSVASGFDQFRQAGAAARAMLIQVAAQQWNVDPAQCTTESGMVSHRASGKQLSYGKLAQSAAALTPPQKATLKDPKEFKLIGKPLKRLDTPQKLNGTGEFGLDVKLPGMLTAVVARAMFGAKVKSVDDSAARKIPGVKKIFQVPSGVAVVADGFWAAKRGRDALKITWDEGEVAGFSTEKQFAEYAELAKEQGLSARKDGDAEKALTSATRKIEAVYQVPYVAHAMMEPLNCVVDLTNGRCEVYTGSQFQTVDRAAAAEVAGVPTESAQLHTTLLGGGFGRRANPKSDFVREATEVAKQAGAPVKVIWTREDDMRGGYYRPAYYHSFIGAIDDQGMPIAWRHRVVGQSIMEGTPFAAFTIKNGLDNTSVEGAADLKYGIPNFAVELHTTKTPVTVQWWRSVGHSHNAFVTESFLDELAVLGKQDPYELRRRLLAKEPRFLGVLELAAEKAGWGKPLPAGRGRGIAVHESFGSYSAQVAEVSVEEGKVRVHRFVCALDCGEYVNPGIVEAQAQSGVIFGMTTALYDELTFKDGKLEQSNFHDFPMVRINECPEIELHIVKSNEKPSGCGEPGVPCVAPAITNAIFAATGKRIRKLPIRMSEAV